MGQACGRRAAAYDPSIGDLPKPTLIGVAHESKPLRPGGAQAQAPASTERTTSGTLRSQIVMQNTTALSDHYEVQKQIGQGSYGNVSLAKHKVTDDVRAVKMISKGSTTSTEALRLEIAIMKAMDHPNIIKLFETFVDRKATYMVMELAGGGELFDRIVEAQHFSEATASIVMEQILRAVWYMQSHDIAHRDLKPENFLFATRDPIPGNTLKLIDFGCACPSEPGRLLKSKVGTAMYMAPQVVVGRYDKMCDVWSAGVILFVLLSGRAPIMGPSTRETLARVRDGRWRFDGESWDRVSDDAKELITALMTRNPKERITPEAAMHHAWFQQTTPKALDVHLGGDVVDRIRSLEASNKIKRAALEIAARHLDDESIKELTALFESLDTNGDGQLSLAEVTEGLTKSGIDLGDLDARSLLALVDGDLSGRVDYTEFLVATLDRKAALTERLLWTTFNVFDQDGDGKISMGELRNVLRSAGVSSSGIADTIKSVDMSGDGTIDFQEFLAMMKTTDRGAAMTGAKVDTPESGAPESGDDLSTEGEEPRNE
mmetsp:Transcript_57394/g.166666  ORF Transcript_57394/g.166666 Transcript_57394/m.166666 type:complete len:545 (-) Transcript_57394:205-1839(-)